MIALLRKELAAKRISLLVYCLLVLGLVVMYTAIFPAIQKQAESFAAVINSMGPAIKAFGVNQISFDTLAKYLSVELFGITWPILIITLATARAGGALSGEIESGSIGLLLAQPFSRWRLFAVKYIAGIFGVILFVAFSTLPVIPVAASFNVTVDARNVGTLFVLCLLFAGAVYGCGMLASAIFSEKGRVYSVVGGVLLLMYIANVVAGLKDSLDWLKYTSLFHYFDSSAALVNQQIDTLSWVVLGGLTAITTIAAARHFNRRDISV